MEKGTPVIKFRPYFIQISLYFIESDRIAKIFMIANFETPIQALLEHKYRKEHAFSPNDSTFIIQGLHAYFHLGRCSFFLHIYTCGFYVYIRYSFFFRRPQPNCLPVTHTLINEHHVMLV